MRWTSFTLLGASGLQALASSSCSCGYFDRSSSQVYTDSIIVYFNETQTVPDDVFEIQSFAHRTEKGWNSVYRQGAVTENTIISNTSSANSTALDLYLDPSTKNHLVNGASIKTKRQDILHGTFRASMQGPGVWTGGSALSMMLWYNQSSSMEIDMLNANDPDNARITTLVNSEYPSEQLSLNYSILEKGSDKLAPVDPWKLLNVRMDWTKQDVNFTIAENQTRSIRYKKENYPTEPLPLIFKHWSTGDSEWMEGPPLGRTVASVAWVRAFFNSSLTTAKQQRLFDAQCDSSLACDVDDMSLRGSSNYTADALISWKEPPRDEKWRIPSAIVAGSSAFFGVVALINVLFRRAPWKNVSFKRKNTEEKPMQGNEGPVEPKKSHNIRSASSSTLGSIGVHKQKWDESSTPVIASSSPTPWEIQTPATLSAKGSATEMFDVALLRKKMAENNAFQNDFAEHFRHVRQSPSIGSDGWSSAGNTLVSPTPVLHQSRSFQMLDSIGLKSPETIRESMEITAIRHGFSNGGEKHQTENTIRESLELAATKGNLPKEDEKSKHANTSVNEIMGQPSLAKLTVDAEHGTPPKKRIDYLAGLVAVSCLCVTFIHFTLTFIPFAGGMFSGEHYKSELYSRWSATPIFLNPIWIGPFFTTSCRFLAGRFLRDGDMSDVAKKMLLRAPRMIIPCLIVASLEYFFIELDLVKQLQWLPSISWSTWPYVSDYPNFGWFMNEVLELAYLIPNKAPGIVSHYCVGILWTIPVQLQFSYVTLLGAVMVRDIKTHWKRFAFYTWCIIVNWYSMSWGSCFWLGLMIADMNATYSYVKWFQARPKAFYPFCLFLCCLLVTGPLFALLEDRAIYPIMTKERGIHPEPSTGLPQSQVESLYPLYYEPRLNTILFAASVQMLTELSTTVQKFLSFRAWIWVFPHTFTVYLIHGFVFWSFGSWLCVTLARQEILPYWSIMLILFLCCYTVIGLAAIVITPLTEGTALAVCRNCWRWATEEPVPHRETLKPFRKDLFLNRNGTDGSTRDEEEAHGTVEILAESNIGGKQKESPFEDSHAASISDKKKDSPFDDINEAPGSDHSPSGSVIWHGISPFADPGPSEIEGLGITAEKEKWPLEK